MKSKEPIRVAIVEDDSHIRSLLIELLEQADGFRCVAGFADAETALESIEELRPDIVLMDINLPGMNGIECVKVLRTKMSSVQVVMLTVYEDNKRIFESLSAGAVGYLLKTTPGNQILELLMDVSEGGAPMSASIARKVVQSFKSEKQAIEHLTERENEILRLLATGMLNKEIGDTLFISVDTVKSHVRSIYHKLQVRTRTEAVIRYYNPNA